MTVPIVSLDLGFAGERSALAVVVGEPLPLPMRQREDEPDWRQPEISYELPWLAGC